MEAVKDWVAWHGAYDDPASALAARLERVREHLRLAISQPPPGPVRLVSLCAGQGHDVIGVLPDHPRRHDVTAVLVESDPRNAGHARRSAAAAGLSRLEVRETDAGQPELYADALPADVLLLCGIFGNVSDEDIRRTVLAAPAMCSAGGTVIWTRHRRAPDLTPRIRAWFGAGGFEEIAFDAIESSIGVGVSRLSRAPGAALPAGPLFTFRGA
jgi:hypothetical protein